MMSVWFQINKSLIHYMCLRKWNVSRLYADHMLCIYSIASAGWIRVLFNSSVTHYDDVRMGAMASQITSLTIVYSTVYSGADESKHQSSASLAFVWGNHRGPVNSPHKWPVTPKMFPFDDVIMTDDANRIWQPELPLFLKPWITLYLLQQIKASL